MISPPASVFASAPSKERHGLARVHCFASLPTAETYERAPSARATEAKVKVSVSSANALMTSRVLFMANLLSYPMRETVGGAASPRRRRAAPRPSAVERQLRADEEGR